MKRLILFVFYSSMLLISCKSKDYRSVIAQYNGNASDSLKLQAARFLVENASGQESLDTASMVKNDKVFYFLDSIVQKNATEERDEKGELRNGKIKIPDDYRGILDGFVNSHPDLLLPVTPKYISDTATLTRSFLNNNIDEAFWAWQNLPWSKEVPFDIFKEYILPYKVINTYWEGTRQYFMEKYKHIIDSSEKKSLYEVSEIIRKDIHLWFKEDGEASRIWPFLMPMSFRNIVRGKLGNCFEATAIRTSAMRAMGIPVAFESVPQWGNVSSGTHYFYTVLDPKSDTITKLIDNANIYRDTRYIVEGSSYVAKLEWVPKDMPVLYNKTIPKIYRKCFSRQANSLAAIKAPDDQVPEFFNDNHLMDVTRKYVEAADVKLTLLNAQKHKYAYLCIFNPKGWEPVQWTKVEGDSVIFKDMGKNIVYLPAYFKNDLLIPAGPAFLLQMNGLPKFLVPTINKSDLKLTRKFRFSSHNAMNAMECFAGRFQGCNDLGLMDTVNLYTNNTFKHKMTEVLLNNTGKFRYLLFQFSGIGNASIAEIEFWGIVDGKEQKLTGTIFGNKGKYSKETEKAFDGNRDSYFFKDAGGPTYIGIDLGQNKRAQITRIRYCPRNDTNDVLPGDTYELFIWNNEWVSLGTKTGVDFQPLTFNAPQGGIYWLRDRTKGKEERIFTYENGKQFFW
ncbi:discoidin domain-containing protein [Niastella populi]|uniref:Peptide-N(4)-(N-acetyl-beta-glucosaminyl)asparagine amidase n=1 Tax=Niastella populi TaxID=550983 RepID=A0A1V9FN93_9BACT|nr:discoidin domain-containing protein [Niastella populi]OQP59825.1 hypothetical protein A4R26_20790 [Niastella populi]